MSSAQQVTGIRSETYHSPLNHATYEQCPWDERHVTAIYPSLRAHLQADGEWHHFPVKHQGIACYRVMDGYFQAISARSPNTIYDGLRAMGPIPNRHDAEWGVRPGEDDRGYALSSSFALAPGPFSHHADVDRWLWRHGLGFQGCGFHIEGLAYFDELSPSDMADAMERLIWLEELMMELNARLDSVSEEYWKAAEAVSDRMLLEAGESTREDEIVPVPATTGAVSPKRRVPIMDGPAIVIGDSGNSGG
jgi:hypothetical protein